VGIPPGIERTLAKDHAASRLDRFGARVQRPASLFERG